MKLRFSIRYKILSMVTALLLAAIIFYLMLATKIFRQDKTELVFDLNKSVVTTLATEVDSTLRGVADKLKLYAYFVGSGRSKSDKLIFKQLLSNDSLVVRLELFEQTPSGAMVSKDQIVESTYEKTYGLPPDYFARILTERHPIPFQNIKRTSLSVWNATAVNGPPLLGMGIPVIREDARGMPEHLMAAIAYVKTDVFLKNMKASRLNQVFILDQNFKVLIHSRPEMMLNQVDYSQSEIVRAMNENKVSVGVKEYDDHGKLQLGAFARVQMGSLTVVSQVESAKAFIAVQSLIRRSLLYAMIISTITFIATIFFSRTLTGPLRRLMSAIERVSEGNLDTELRVHSFDEIAVLSNSFNRMTQDLKTSRFQLEEINRELENKVIDRTKKLEEQNRAVKVAQEALLRTTRLASVGEIAGRTAHEVLNPLTSLMARIQKVQKRLTDEITSNKTLLEEILGAWKKELGEKGFAGLMKSLEEPSKINPEINLLQEDLENFNFILSAWDADLSTLDSDTKFLMQQAMRIEKILRQMRSLSVVSSQRTQLKVQPLIHDAINIVADLFAKNKIEMRETFSSPDLEVQVDRDELIQVLTNMLRNSLQAVMEVDKAQKLVEIHTSFEKDRLMIDIVDNGVGISEENKPKLFENQFSTKAPDEGTGLGLSISRRFVRAFQGDLYLLKTSQQNGTTFRIELPLAIEKTKRVAA